MIDQTFGEKIEDAKYYDRPGTYLLCVKDSKLAVVKIPKGYFLPGGGIDEGESKEDCLKRECIEELGCKVSIIEYLGCAEMYSIHERYGHFHPIQYFYIGEVLEKIVEPVELDHELQWIPLDEVQGMLYLQTQQWAVEQLIGKKKLQ